jgi:hypothetical protein
MECDTARVTYRRLWLKIELGVPNAGTVAGNNTTGVLQAAAMGHCTFADVSDDFHVRVSMWGKPLFGAISSSFQKRSGPHPKFVSAGEKWCLAWSQSHRSPESERKGRRSITAFSEESAV